MKQCLIALVLASSILISSGLFLAGTASASNSIVIPFNCPGFGSVDVLINGNGAVGHAVGTHLIGVNLGSRGNAGTPLAGRLVTCTSAVGSAQIFFPAGR